MLGTILPLSLSIGGTVGVVALVDHVLSGQQPWRDPQTLFLLSHHDRSSEVPELVWSYPGIHRMQTLPHESIESIEPVGFSKVIATEAANGAAQRLEAEFVSPNYFRLLGVSALPGEGRLDIGAEMSGTLAAVLSDGAWRLYFHHDPGILGRPLIINGTSLSIVGIAPSGFDGISGSTEIFIPISSAPTVLGLESALSDRYWAYGALVRFNPGSSPSLQQAELARLSRALALDSDPRHTVLRLVSPRQAIVSVKARQSLLMILGAAACVLLLVCSNVAMLAVLRALSGRADINVRMALGANRLQAVSRFVREGVVITMAGFLCALLFSRWIIDYFWAARPKEGVSWASTLALLGPPSLGRASISAMIGSLVIVILAMVWWPTLEARRASAGPRPLQLHGDRPRVRVALVVLQVAVAFVLAHGTLLLLSTVRAVRAESFGVRREGLVIVRIQLPRTQFDRVRAAGFYESLLPRLRAVHGIDGVSLDNTLPLANDALTTSVAIAGAAAKQARYHTIDPSHFLVMGIPLTRGRPMSPSAPEVVVSETAARQLWADRSPINETILLPSADGLTGGSTRATVVGVVGDVQYDHPGSLSAPDIYISARIDAPTDAYLLLRTQATAGSVLTEVRQIVRTVDSRAIVYDALSLQGWLGRVMAGTMFIAKILVFYAVLALGITLLGVYSISAYHVALRTREFGIKRAIGAPTKFILAEVIGDGARIAVSGIALGLLATALSYRLFKSQIVGIGVFDVGLVALCATLFIAVAFIGTIVPALRAIRIDPALALAVT